MNIRKVLEEQNINLFTPPKMKNDKPGIKKNNLGVQIKMLGGPSKGSIETWQ